MFEFVTCMSMGVPVDKPNGPFNLCPRWCQVPQPIAAQQNMMAQSMGQGMGQGMVNHGSLPTGMMGTLSGMGVGDCEYLAILVASMALCLLSSMEGVLPGHGDSWLGYVLV